MADNTQRLLEQILTSLLLARSSKFRIAWLARERERLGREIADDEIPDGNFFVDQAIDEVTNAHKYVVSKLTE